MKKLLRTFAVVACTSVVFVSCKKTAENTVDQNGISSDDITMIKAAGLHAEGATKVEGKFLIEGDILLSAEELRNMVGKDDHNLIVADEEHYRTTNTVTSLPRTITVRYTGAYSSLSTAITNAVARYNALGLRLTFQKVSSTSSASITVSDVTGASYIASAGFPSGGNAFNSIKFNTAYTGWSSSTLTSTMAHEIGHCIGFRHTDYMSRQYSCGGAAYNEGASTVGAVHIPGTPTGVSANSWMLACIGNGVNRPFTSSDNTALQYVY